jgi:predicted enzyme related to lactoylglutathione lyase
MRITLASVTVNDQAQARRFYTEVLAFVVKNDLPVGEHRWLTVTSPEGVAAGPVTVAVFDDTCGNLIQLHQAGGRE